MYCRKTQPPDSVKDFTKKHPRHSRFRHLKYHVTRMPDYFGYNLDQLGSQRPQGPLLQCLGQCQPSEKIAEVVSQSKYPQKII
jgi:hypothetical protein